MAKKWPSIREIFTRKTGGPRRFYVEIATTETELPEEFPVDDIQEIETQLKAAEEQLKTFAEKWDFAADAACQLQIREVQKISAAIEKELNQALHKTLNKICKANLEFIREALLGYESSVRSQWFSFFRLGRRKKLKVLNKEFSKPLDILENTLSQTKNFDDLAACIDDLSQLINYLITQAESLKLNTRNFRRLTDELITQRHPLLTIKDHYAPEEMEKLFRELRQPLQKTVSENSEETKKLLRSNALRDALSNAHRHFSTSETHLKRAVDERSSYHLEAAQVSVLGIGSNISSVQTQFLGLVNNLTGRIFGQANKYKTDLVKATQETFKKAVNTAKENYHQHLEKIIADYRAQVKKQWFSRIRQGQKKLDLLEQYLAGQTSLKDLKENTALNEGKFASVLAKISTLYQKFQDLEKAAATLETKASEKASILDKEMKYTVDQLESPLKWLADASEEVDTAKETIREVLQRATTKQNPAGPTPPISTSTMEEKEIVANSSNTRFPFMGFPFHRFGGCGTEAKSDASWVNPPTEIHEIA